MSKSPGKSAIERILREYFEKEGEKVEKIVYLPWYEDVDAKYIKKLKGAITLIGNTYAGVVVVDGVQIPFVAEIRIDGKVHIYLYPYKDFYLSHLAGEMNDSERKRSFI